LETAAAPKLLTKQRADAPRTRIPFPP